MAAKKWLHKYVLYCLLVFVLSKNTIVSSSEVFISQPKDITAQEGENVSFFCSVKHLNRTTISWMVRPDHNTDETIEGFDHHMASTLTVQNIDQYDRYITCHVSYTSLISGQYQRRNFSSRRAKLSVICFPRQNELTCSPEDKIALQGELLSIHCKVNRCKPAVDLTWSLQSAEDNYQLPLPKIHDDGLMRNLSGEMRVNRELHNKRIICIVTSELAFPGRSLECSTGQIKVLAPPSVTVYPRNAILEDQMAVRFTCMADGYPKVFDFSWTCSSDLELAGCNEGSTSTNKSVVHISASFSITDTEYATITCTATNKAGSNSFQSNLMITPQKVPRLAFTDLPSQPNRCLDTSKPLNISLRLHDQITEQSTQILQCNVSGYIPDDITRKWYYNGFLITENDEGFIMTNVKKPLYALYSLNLSKATGIKDIICEVTACNHTVRSSVNVSLNAKQLSNKVSDLGSYPSSSTGTPAHPTMPKPGKLATWKIVVMAIAGVLATILLTACVVAAVTIMLYRHLSKTNTDTSEKGPQIPTCQEVPCTASVFYEVPSVADPSFAKISAISTESDETSSNSLQDTYASEIIRDSFSSTPTQSSSWTSSSDAYMSTSPPGKRAVGLHDDKAKSLRKHEYVNQDIINLNQME